MRHHPQIIALLVLSALAGMSCTARAHEGHMHHHPQPTACQTTALACASVATPAFDRDGKFWLMWVAGGRVSVASSADLGKTFSKPVTLPKTKLPLDDGPDARPKIAFGPQARAVLAFTTRDDKYNGHAFIARSSDGGQTFSEPQPMTTETRQASVSRLRHSMATDASLPPGSTKETSRPRRHKENRMQARRWPTRGTTSPAASSKPQRSRGTTAANAAASPLRSQAPENPS